MVPSMQQPGRLAASFPRLRLDEAGERILSRFRWLLRRVSHGELLIPCVRLDDQAADASHVPGMRRLRKSV